jgi:uncharacterized SAM-binding protein YcdF (DUF218 family)
VLRFLRSAFAAIGVLLVLITGFPFLLSGWIGLLSGAYRAPRGDVLIVLGGDQLETHTIGVTSYWRSVYAARVWRGGGFREILICGGPSSGPVSELMKRFLVSEGVPPSAIVLETESLTTRENATGAARILQNEPGVKVLLSSDYHIFRASKAFRKAGLSVTATYFPDAAKRLTHWQDRWRVFLDLCLETAKIGWYKAQGWI